MLRHGAAVTRSNTLEPSPPKKKMAKEDLIRLTQQTVSVRGNQTPSDEYRRADSRLPYLITWRLYVTSSAKLLLPEKLPENGRRDALEAAGRESHTIDCPPPEEEILLREGSFS